MIIADCTNEKDIVNVLSRSIYTQNDYLKLSVHQSTDGQIVCGDGTLEEKLNQISQSLTACVNVKSVTIVIQIDSFGLCERVVGILNKYLDREESKLITRHDIYLCSSIHPELLKVSKHFQTVYMYACIPISIIKDIKANGIKRVVLTRSIHNDYLILQLLEMGVTVWMSDVTNDGERFTLMESGVSGFI